MYMRQHPKIKGIAIGGRMHTISLFVDDIILILTDVLSSLASVQQALRLFNAISYYKVNETKSYLLGLGLPDKVLVITSHIVERKWYSISRKPLHLKFPN